MATVRETYMYYNLQAGMHRTWRDRFGVITNNMSGRSLLPMVVTAIMALWVGLIFAALQQTGPNNPGTPSDLTATKSHMTVSGTPAHTPNLNSSSNASSVASSQPVQTTADVSTMDSSTASTEDSVAPIIGGKGGDPTPTVITPDIPTPVPEPAVDLTVDTPLTPNPITVGLDTDNGLQLDLGLGL